MGILERALQLAATGECRGIEDIRTGLVREGYLEIDAYLAGFTLHRQLNRALKRGRRDPARGETTDRRLAAGAARSD